MVEKLTDIVLTVGGFQLYLLAAVVLARNGGRHRPKALFAAFLLTKALLITRWFCFRHGILTVAEGPELYLLSAALFFLLAPLLYLYIQSLCYKDIRLSRAHLLHAVPFLAVVAFAATGLRLLNTGPGLAPGMMYDVVVNHFWEIFWFANLVQIFFYILAMLRTVRAYQAKLEDVYASVEGINLRWLVTLIAVIGLHWIFVSSRAALAFLGAEVPMLIAILDLFSITIFLVFTTVLAIRGIGQIRFFAGIEERPKYAASKLPDPEVETLAGRLRDLMETRKPYLTPSLTIEDLAAALSVPSWQLSQVINRSFGQNFFSFVNGYRIEEAKRRLSDPDGRKLTILQILLDAGFNSKSAFNEAFRKHAGMTPREFRKACQS